MRKQKIWNFYAKIYKNMFFLQKHSLRPTRQKVLSILDEVICNSAKEYKILDIGCGIGQLLFEIKERFKDYKLHLTGIDPAEMMIEKANIANSFSNIKFNLCSIENIALDSQYDVIICTHSLPYVSNMKNSFSKIYEFLADDGVFIFGQATCNKKYDRIVMKIVENFVSKANYPSVNNIKNDLITAGFKLMKLEYIKTIIKIPPIFVMSCMKDKEN